DAVVLARDRDRRLGARPGPVVGGVARVGVVLDPHLVLADHGPGALLADKLQRIASVRIGDAVRARARVRVAWRSHRLEHDRRPLDRFAVHGNPAGNGGDLVLAAATSQEQTQGSYPY